MKTIKKWLIRTKLFFHAIGLLSLIVMIFQNTTPTSVYFLSFEFVLPLSLWLVAAFLMGALILVSFFLLGWPPFMFGSSTKEDKKKTTTTFVTTTTQPIPEKIEIPAENTNVDTPNN